MAARQSKPEEAVMAGDGDRVPDVSEQRAEVEDGQVAYTVAEAAWSVACPFCGVLPGRSCLEGGRQAGGVHRGRLRLSGGSDPASVLAALLAESPEATVSAIEALLTSDKAVAQGADGVYARFVETHKNHWPETSYSDLAQAALSAACRSLLSKAPKEEDCPDCWGGRPKWAGTMPAPPCPTCGGTGKIPWSPQREDHEVGIEAARQVLHGYVWHERLSDVTRATVAAYLSRVSPSRDGTVAVEDAERLQAAIDKAYGAMNASAYVGGPSEREAWQTALAALGEVVTQHKGQGLARAGESNEGGH